MLRLIVADDHRPVREVLVKLLEREEDMVVVGQAADGTEAMECARSLAADILILDLNRPEMDGFEVLDELQDKPKPSVIVVSLKQEINTIRRTLAAGAAGYVSKQAAIAELVPAFRVVAARRRYLCTVARAQLVSQ